MNPLKIFQIGEKIIDKVLPDRASRDSARQELEKLKLSGELEAMRLDQEIVQGQIEINKLDAASGNWFQAGWRPAAGWICVFGLGYTFLLQPLMPWALQVAGMMIGTKLIVPSLPAIESEALMTMLGCLLGIGGFRTFEKAKRVSK